MAKDLTIRQLNRPQVSEESELGLRTITRSFVVQGDRVSYASINDSTWPLFLPIGEEDEEFTGYLLVNQQIRPAQGDVDRAYLTRQYVQLRTGFFSESTSQSNDLIRVTRKYAVLRSDHATYGYGANWSKNPNNPQAAAYLSGFTPWDYAPPIITDPAQIAYSYADNSNVFSGNSASDIQVVTGVNSNGDYTFASLNSIQNGVGVKDMGKWLRGRASVSQAMPGVDIWEVEWVTHNEPYWTVGTARGGSVKVEPLTVVDFDHHGLLFDDFGASGGSSSSLAVAKTTTFFYVGADLPEDFVNISGGSGSAYVPNTVHIDITITDRDRKKININKHLSNAVFKVTGTGGSEGLKFPLQPGGDLSNGNTVAERSSKRRLEFKYQADPANPFSFVAFKNEYIRNIGGSISWTRSHLVADATTSSTAVYSTSTKITPLFSYKSDKIWKIELTYIG